MTSNPKTSTWRQAPEFRLAIIAVVVFALMGILSPERFLSEQNLTSMAFQFPEFAILALAITLVMMTGGIDLSVVGIANLSAVVAALILTEFAGPDLPLQASLLWLGFALGASLLIGAMVGLLNGTLVAFLGLPSWDTSSNQNHETNRYRLPRRRDAHDDQAVLNQDN